MKELALEEELALSPCWDPLIHEFHTNPGHTYLDIQDLSVNVPLRGGDTVFHNRLSALPLDSIQTFFHMDSFSIGFQTPKAF